MSSKMEIHNKEIRKASLIEIIMPQLEIKHITQISNLSTVLSVVFIIYSIVNIALYYFTGESIPDNIDVNLSIVSLVMSAGFTIYIFIIEKWWYRPSKVAVDNKNDD